MNIIQKKISGIYNILYFKFNNIKFGKRFRVLGNIGLDIKGKVIIGDYFRCISGGMLNPMGRNVKSFIKVSKNAQLIIGNNVGISCCVLRCANSIILEDNIRIGAMTIITDTDAHSLDPELRKNWNTDTLNAKTKPIHIKENVFIGASCIICKGVTIGKNSIVGAGSVVTRNIPENEIWAGNPARHIRDLDYHDTKKD